MCNMALSYSERMVFGIWSLVKRNKVCFIMLVIRCVTHTIPIEGAILPCSFHIVHYGYDGKFGMRARKCQRDNSVYWLLTDNCDPPSSKHQHDIVGQSLMRGFNCVVRCY